MIAELSHLMGEVKILIDTYRSGKIIREGFKIAIAGRPNAGKSSLFNLLLNQNRAIVAPIPGTTRDYLTEWIDLNGIAVSITDTAGFRKGSGVIEKAGQKSASEILQNSDLVLWLSDITRREWQKEVAIDLPKLPPNLNILLLYNKVDRLRRGSELFSDSEIGKGIPISCLSKFGLDKLRREIICRITEGMPDLTDQLVVTSERHKRKLESALKLFKHAGRGIAKSLSPELIAFELRQGINEIDEITGRIYNEGILDRIFARFCIGK
jgi:tRNA modification GTPase